MGIKQLSFRGLFPILHTPFTEGGDVDFDSLRRLVSHVGEQGVAGMVFPGFASEFWRLTEAEILECATVIAGQRPENVHAVFNVTAQASLPAIRWARQFEQLGAAGLMTLPPFVVPVPAPALEGHLAGVLAATPLPCILQDAAGLTGTNLDPQALVRLREAHPNFAAIKVDQVPTGPAISRYRSEPGLAGLAFLVGYSGVQMLDAARRGAVGLMGGCGHLAQDSRMLEALLSGDEQGGYREFVRLSPLLNFEMQNIDLSISVHKRMLFEAGVIASPLSRMPCRTMDEIHLGELRLHLGALGAGPGTIRG